MVRRLSGGGAVYHDMGNLNFTFIADAGSMESINFKLFCQPVVAALAALGVQAEVNGRNDMTINGQKFSGNSQYLKEGRVMHHGTIMFDSNLDRVAQALHVDQEKIAAKGVVSVRSRVCPPTAASSGILRSPATFSAWWSRRCWQKSWRACGWRSRASAMRWRKRMRAAISAG